VRVAREPLERAAADRPDASGDIAKELADLASSVKRCDLVLDVVLAPSIVRTLVRRSGPPVRCAIPRPAPST